MQIVPLTSNPEGIRVIMPLTGEPGHDAPLFLVTGECELPPHRTLLAYERNIWVASFGREQMLSLLASWSTHHRHTDPGIIEISTHDIRFTLLVNDDDEPVDFAWEYLYVVKEAVA